MMIISIFTIACSFGHVLSSLIYGDIVYHSACVHILTCQGHGLIIPTNKVQQHKFPLQDECGHYFYGGVKNHCPNIRNKLYFQCQDCRTIYRENEGTPTAIKSGEICTDDHYNKEIHMHTKMDLIGSIYGQVRLKPLPSSTHGGN
ncbi:hypothetical protein PGT21_019259 [Puccinia graminis f. sp. tritici]|uniref:Secreted protein n=1 Tax=Puccinia graminis f. sp. tritici TaxID=56615 RepID=A0A5B0MPA2_PUCGR|nr:hypothetical protein PGT21_019259 [Puccinia graminis f. sp. tritici]KAA1125912.1 hypothetical protein PGTUg99_019030 [Puccinia graminis f. sp. tritici]